MQTPGFQAEFSLYSSQIPYTATPLTGSTGSNAVVPHHATIIQQGACETTVNYLCGASGAAQCALYCGALGVTPFGVGCAVVCGAIATYGCSNTVDLVCG